LAIFADNMYYKVEAYIGTPSAGKVLYDEGLTPIYVSDNPVLNAQHVVFEAAKGFHYGLPYHAALASVTTAPADTLGMGQRLGKIKAGFDADIVVWDSDPLSVGAAPVQVWIDGRAQFADPVVLSKPRARNAKATMVVPDAPPELVEEPVEVADVLFRGVARVLLDEHDVSAEDGESLNVAIRGGKISCIGECADEFKVATAAGVEVITLRNGHLHRTFVGAGGTLGLNEIDGESMTDNGNNPRTFTRAVDGLLLEGKKLKAAHHAGVTRAISAPKFKGGNTHHGTSVGIVTSARTSLDEGAVFGKDDVAVHYTLDPSVRGAEESYSAAFGSLREKLIRAGRTDKDKEVGEEEAFLKRVLASEMVLALTINSADGIATALRIKEEVDKQQHATSSGIKMAIIGGAEAYLVAEHLAAANVGVILSPLQSYGETWDARRAVPGAPLTNGTNIDRLLDAGVKVGIGLKEDWEVRDLVLAAGTAYENGEGRLTDRQALDLVSRNVLEILGVEEEVPGEMESAGGHFVVSEGWPLGIESRVVAVGSGRGVVSLFV
jgi:imidazolonepropionase-like amidohydrolase